MPQPRPYGEQLNRRTRHDRTPRLRQRPKPRRLPGLQTVRAPAYGLTPRTSSVTAGPDDGSPRYRPPHEQHQHSAPALRHTGACPAHTARRTPGRKAVAHPVPRRAAVRGGRAGEGGGGRVPVVGLTMRLPHPGYQHRTGQSTGHPRQCAPTAGRSRAATASIPRPVRSCGTPATSTARPAYTGARTATRRRGRSGGGRRGAVGCGRAAG